MATKKQDYISVQQIRDDPNGFVDNLSRGKSYTILRRSRPVVSSVRGTGVTSSSKYEPGSKEAMREFVRLADIIRSSSKPVLNPDKSIKELYHEMLDEKYGISRR
jgi:hypothetical protein